MDKADDHYNLHVGGAAGNTATQLQVEVQLAWVSGWPDVLRSPIKQALSCQQEFFPASH